MGVRWSELPLTGGFACQAGEITARAGVLHEFAHDIAGGVDEYPYRDSDVTVDSFDDGAYDFGELFVKNRVGVGCRRECGLSRWHGGRAWRSGR